MCVGIQPAASCQFQYRRLILLFLRQRWLAGWLAGWCRTLHLVFFVVFFNRSVAAYDVLFSYSPTLWHKEARATSQAASCTSAAAINVPQFLGSVLRCRGMQTLAAGSAVCTPPRTHPLSPLQKCLSALERFSQVQMHLKVYCTISAFFLFFFFFNAFQWRGAQYAACMSSKNINTLKEELPHLPFFFFFLSESWQMRYCT